MSAPTQPFVRHKPGDFFEENQITLCGFGIFFLPDPEGAVAGFRRALAPGGRLGVSTWGVEDERWSWEDELFADLVVERRAVQRPFDQASDLEALLRGGGFDDVVVHTVHHEVTLAGPEEWWAWEVVLQLARGAGADRAKTTRRVIADAGRGCPNTASEYSAAERPGPPAGWRPRPRPVIATRIWVRESAITGEAVRPAGSAKHA